MDIREEFEKLPEIADSLSEHIYFGGDGFYHSSLVNFQGLVNWLNGAWYAFQEQQKKIDAIKSKLSDIYDASDEDETVAHLLDEIQELLKWT